MQESNWSLLSKYRAPLMGAAMLFIMLFHVPLARAELLYGLARCGNVGVDMFLFLSGIGLWFSWSKNVEKTGGTEIPKLTLNFFYRRYIRIYPAWLIIATLFYVPDYLAGTGVQRSPDVLQLILNILVNWSFWRMDDLTFWFIPAIMMMYTFAPAYMELIRRHPSWRWLPLFAIVWYVAIRHYPPLWKSVGHVEIFWSRIPVFLLGINCGQWVKEQRPLSPSSVWLQLLLFILSLLMCIWFENHRRGAFPPLEERMLYIPLAVSAMLLLCHVFAYAPQWLLKALKFVGGISLEIYLVHTVFVLKHLLKLRLGYGLTALLLILISIPLAWLLSIIVDLLMKRLPKNVN